MMCENIRQLCKDFCITVSCVCKKGCVNLAAAARRGVHAFWLNISGRHNFSLLMYTPSEVSWACVRVHLGALNLGRKKSWWISFKGFRFKLSHKHCIMMHFWMESTFVTDDGQCSNLSSNQFNSETNFKLEASCNYDATDKNLRILSSISFAQSSFSLLSFTFLARSPSETAERLDSAGVP